MGPKFGGAIGVFLRFGEYATERDIHALDREGQGKEFPTTFGGLFNLEAGTRVVGEADNTRKAVKTVTNCNIQGFAKDAVTLMRVGEDLGAAARDVEDDGVDGLRD